MSELIEKIHYKQLSLTDFEENYAGKKPLIITGLVDSWPSRDWDTDYLQSNYGEREIIIRKSGYDQEKKFYKSKLGKFIGILNDNPEKLYCDWPFSIMGNEDLEGYFETPSLFNHNTIKTKNKKKLKWIFLGSVGTGTPIHQDFEKSHNWNAVVFGQKKWIFFSPDDTEYVKEFKHDLFDLDLKEDPNFKYTTPYIVEQFSGELMYTPKNWWHTVRNIETSFSVSENFWYKDEKE